MSFCSSYSKVEAIAGYRKQVRGWQACQAPLRRKCIVHHPASHQLEAGGGALQTASPHNAAQHGLFFPLQVEAELEKICNELLEVLEKYLVPEDKSTEGQVFYLKMAGDYYRYLAEFAAEGDRASKVSSAWGLVPLEWRCGETPSPTPHVRRTLRRRRRPRRSTRAPPRQLPTCLPPTPFAWVWR